MAKYDILPSKDMQKVKKDLTDIKNKLSTKKPRRSKKRVLKVVPYNDVVDVRKDLKDIKKTLIRTTPGKTRRKLGNVTHYDNYYDILPHQTVKELEFQLTSLKDKLKKKGKSGKKGKSVYSASTKRLMTSMNRLNKSISNLVMLFEKADEFLKAPESAPLNISTTSSTTSTKVDLSPMASELGEVKARLEELSAENEEMAKGILVIAEMLKENPPQKKQEQILTQELYSTPADSGFSEPSASTSFNVPPPPLPPINQQHDDIPPIGSPFESFYPKPGDKMPPLKEAPGPRRPIRY